MRFQDIQAFLETLGAADSKQKLEELVGRFLSGIGFGHFACVSHVDRANPPEAAANLHNYPKPWEAHFRECHLEKIDPVQRYARFTILPFHWNDPQFQRTLTRDQLLIFQDAAAFGLEKGYTVPLHGPEQRSASFSVSPDKHSIDPESYSVVQLVAPFIFEQALRLCDSPVSTHKDIKKLTPREFQCLRLAALGKSDWVIGEILCLSEKTVHGYLESAKKRLGVATRAQAIVQALHDAQMSIDDLQST